MVARRLRNPRQSKRTYILISGSRHLSNNHANKPSSMIHKFLTTMLSIFGPPLTVIHGDCGKGVDSIVKSACQHLKIDQILYPANWDKYGRKAGWIRNNLMFDHGIPDYVVCIFNDLNHRSPGTLMTANLSRKYKVPCFMCDLGMLDSEHYSDTVDMLESCI